MPKSKSIELPPCGLYRTGQALASDPENIPEGVLVMFHNHSNRGIPMLQLPAENEHNFWTFHKYGPGIEGDDAFVQALQPLREQGLYFLGEDVETPDGILPRHTLIQLGYDMGAHPILFLPERSTTHNALSFPDVGFRFDDLDILEVLQPSFPLVLPGDDDDDEEEGVEAVPSSELLN